MSKKVYIGVGHGGSDPGAVKYLVEKDINLKMALACRDYLIANGVLVKMSRETDKTVSINTKTSEANAWGADLALDIHNNAGGGKGAEVLHSISYGVSAELARNILAELVDIGQNSRGAKTKKNANGYDYFGFIRQTKMPSVITEALFVDNIDDASLADTDEECKIFGIAIAKGILKTLGIDYNNTTQSTTKPTQTTTSTTASTCRLLKIGSVGEDVMTLQKNLNKVINSGLQVDGDFGYATDRAVKTFQSKYGLVIDGIYGSASRAKMEEALKCISLPKETYEYTRVLKKGCSGDDVKNLQISLNKIINAGLTCDGIFGSLTEKSVKNFQSKYGLVVDGIFGSKSSSKMNELLS